MLANSQKSRKGLIQWKPNIALNGLKVIQSSLGIFFSPLVGILKCIYKDILKYKQNIHMKLLLHSKNTDFAYQLSTSYAFSETSLLRVNRLYSEDTCTSQHV